MAAHAIDSHGLVSGEFASAAATAINSLRDVRLGGEAHLLTWVTNTCRLFVSVLNNLQRQWPEANLEHQVTALGLGAERAAGMLDLLAIVERAREALGAAQEAATKAKGAAGIAGGAALSGHFSTYAQTERRAAETFRLLSIAALIAAVIVAIFIHPAEGDWSGVVYRVAILGGVGALSAYFARQAGHHRRVFNWAKGLEVQLQSFPAFIEQTGTGARDDIYRAFAHRVLGAPPESSGGSDDTLPTGQLIEALIALAKRPN